MAGQQQGQQPPVTTPYAPGNQQAPIRVWVSPAMLGLPGGEDIPVDLPRDTPQDQIPALAVEQAQNRLKGVSGGELPKGMGQGGGQGGPQGVPQFGFLPPARDRRVSYAPAEPVEVGEALPEIAGAVSMLPFPGATAAGMALAPLAEYGRQRLAGEETDTGSIVDAALLNSLPLALRAGKLPAKMAEAFGTRARALTRGGAEIQRGMPQMSARFNTASETLAKRTGMPLQTDAINRMAAIAKAEKLGINPESFAKLDARGTTLLNQIAAKLPRNVAISPGDDVLALAKQHLPKTPENKLLIQQFEDTTNIYTLMKQSERAGVVSGANPSRFVSGASTGGLAQMAAGAAGASLPAASGLGMTIGIPAAFLNLGAKQSLAAANLFDTIADVGVPVAEGAVRAGMAAHSASGKPRRRKKPGEKEE